MDIKNLLVVPQWKEEDGQARQDPLVFFHGNKISDAETRTKLEALSHLLGQPIHVTSGDRTHDDQERLIRQGKNPAKNSQHLLGRAADIWVEGMTPAEVAPFAREVGFTGIGIYRDGHLHVDTRPESAFWEQ